MIIKSKVNGRSVNLSSFRSTTVNEVLEIISNQEGQAFGLNLINPNTSPVYVKFYDVAGGATVGTSPVLETYMVPSNGTIIIEVSEVSQIIFENRLEIAATAGFADSDSASPGTNDLIAQISYNAN